MWLASIMAIIVNSVVGQPVVFGIVGVVDDEDLYGQADGDDYDLFEDGFEESNKRYNMGARGGCAIL